MGKCRVPDENPTLSESEDSLYLCGFTSSMSGFEQREGAIIGVGGDGLRLLDTRSLASSGRRPTQIRDPVAAFDSRI